MSLTVRVREHGKGVWRVYLVGSLDGKTSPILRKELEALRGEGARVITFDLKDLSYLSAAGLEAILATIEALEARGGRWSLRTSGRRFARCSTSSRVRQR